MTYLAETFDGEGANGANVVSGNSMLDSVIAGTSITFDNTHTAHGPLACKCVASTNTSCALWIASMGTQAEVWFRGYFHLANATPAATLWLFNALQGTSSCARVGVSTGLKVLTQESTNTTQTTSTATVNANAWFRVEAQMVFSATAGSIQVKFFNTMDSVTPTETDTSGSALNTLANADHYRFGLTTQSAFTLWQDDIALSNVAYIGAASYTSDPDTGAGADGGTGPSGGTHERIGVDDAVGFP